MLPVIHPPPTNKPFEWLSTDDTAVPMLPAIALKVIELVSNPDVTATSLAPVVSKDQVLASRVIGLGNSAAYAGYQPATTLLEAMVRLGTVAVRNVVVTVSFASRFCVAPTAWSSMIARLMPTGRFGAAPLIASRPALCAFSMIASCASRSSRFAAFAALNFGTPSALAAAANIARCFSNTCGGSPIQRSRRMMFGSFKVTA